MKRLGCLLSLAFVGGFLAASTLAAQDLVINNVRIIVLAKLVRRRFQMSHEAKERREIPEVSTIRAPLLTACRRCRRVGLEVFDLLSRDLQHVVQKLIRERRSLNGCVGPRWFRLLVPQVN